MDGIDVRKIDDILIHLQRVKTVGDDMDLEILRDGRTTNMSQLFFKKDQIEKK